MPDTSKRILVTGASGCIGRATVRRLLKAGYGVRAIDRNPMPQVLSDLAGAQLEWWTASLNPEGARFVSESSPVGPEDGWAVEQRSMGECVAGCDAVVHLLGLVHRPDLSDIELYREVNVSLTQALLDAFVQSCETSGKAHGAFILASTVAVYGAARGEAIDESTATSPQTPYAITKAEAESVVLGHPQGIVLRFPVVYGAGDRGNVAKLARAIAARRFVLPGKCNAKRSFLASENAAHAVALACALARVGETHGGADSAEASSRVLGSSERRFLITDDHDLTVAELARTLAKANGGRGVPRVPLSLMRSAALVGDCLGRLGLSAPVTSQVVMQLTEPLTFSCEHAKRVLGYQPLRHPLDALSDAMRTC